MAARSSRARGAVWLSMCSVALIGTSLVGSRAGAAVSVPTPAGYPAIYTAAISDALAATSFHEETDAFYSTSHSHLSEDAARSGGVESEEVSSPSTLFGFTARLVHARLYLKGDQITLTDLAGLSQFAGGYNAGRWLTVPSSSKVFNELAYGIDVKTGIEQVELGRPIAVTHATYDHHPVIALTSATGIHASSTSGAAVGRFTLFVTTGRRPLPVAEAFADDSGGTKQGGTITFSRWNRPVTLSKPSPTFALP